MTQHADASTYSLLFKSADGEKVLKDLMYVFYDVEASLDSAHKTVVAAGNRDVILYIKRQIEKGEKI